MDRTDDFIARPHSLRGVRAVLDASMLIQTSQVEQSFVWTTIWLIKILLFLSSGSEFSPA